MSPEWALKGSRLVSSCRELGPGIAGSRLRPVSGTRIASNHARPGEAPKGKAYSPPGSAPTGGPAAAQRNRLASVVAHPVEGAGMVTFPVAMAILL